MDHQASGLVVIAASDNAVEALELPGKPFVLAVQWHPEDRTDWPDPKLFDAFHDAMTTSRQNDAAGVSPKQLKGTATAEVDLQSTVVVRVNGLNHQIFSYVYGRSRGCR